MGGPGEPGQTQETQQVAEEVTEEMEEMGMGIEMEGMEWMETGEIEHVLPDEMQLRQQEEEAVRNAIERRETLIRDGMDPNLASNFDYDYNPTHEEDYNAGEYILRSNSPHFFQFSHYFSTLI